MRFDWKVPKERAGGANRYRKIFTDGRIAPRSGLASKNFIDTGAGVIDADYRGQVKVLLFNHAEKDFEGRFCWGRKRSLDGGAVWLIFVFGDISERRRSDCAACA